ncbi:hypothetical protein Pmani_004104, partial [Petrolisthes manimaculis]
ESVLEKQLHQAQNHTPTHQGYRSYIEGSREVFVQAGSTLSLVCVVKGTPPPSTLLWYHQNQLLHHKHHQHEGVSEWVEESEGEVTSRLRVSSVNFNHSGNYTCLPVGAATTTAASVTVHVSNDEVRAAVQVEGNFFISIYLALLCRVVE